MSEDDGMRWAGFAPYMTWADGGDFPYLGRVLAGQQKDNSEQFWVRHDAFSGSSLIGPLSSSVEAAKVAHAIADHHHSAGSKSRFDWAEGAGMWMWVQINSGGGDE